MDTKMLDQKYHIDMKTGFLYRYIKSETEYFRPHYHNYYELFLVLKGKMYHMANGEEQIISPGDLFFMRDFDVHNYRQISQNESFVFINIAFTRENFDKMAEFFGEAFPKKELLKSKLPPHVVLTHSDTEKFYNDISTIYTSENDTLRCLKLRKFIADIFTKYFLNIAQKPENIPLWLEMTYEKMKKTQNFTCGIEKMYEISGKSREHVSRSMKKYYGISPLEYINELRVSYGANLLLSSNLSITEICYECGFQNLSWFYAAFKRKYLKTPYKYRKEQGL